MSSQQLPSGEQMSETTKPTPLHWEIEDSHPKLVESLKNALRNVKDPEIGMDIIQLGLVRNVTLLDEVITIKMMLTTPFCPYGPSLLESARSQVETVMEKTTRIDFCMDPWDFSMMEDGATAKWGLY
jgi:metal-sulfur cluster biosynthetic enzyme